ncbi:hypothetical protein Lalb_Chr08g0230781 [Lupinus albus]|uniref:TPX2 C-terminal domain-containing protein n=1 Tax=Lupinus albus TaxID=3870 RepID=A0A6A4Q308_LUPAL|nr:hypothetical protein Lalb_Chr08g0230781 [Lupinus albus]
MVEPTTCLVRSLSSPPVTSISSSLTQQQVDPMRVLGESISFGRFLSESMDWERWSAFTHKRYVEEAEKYSKPGSVAAKKAYFEAHYKRKAQEKAAALTEEANAQANDTSDSETQEGNCNDTSVEKKSKADHIVIVEQPNKDAVNYQVVDDTNQYECDVGQSVLDISNVEGAAENTAQTCVGINLNVENHVLDNSNKEIVIPVEEKISDPGIAGYEVLPLPVKGREVNSSPKLSTKTTMVKPSQSLNKRKDAAALPSLKSGTMCKKSDRSSFEKIGLTARSLRMSISLPSGAGKGNKTAVAAEQPRNGVNSILKSKKSDRNLFENASLNARSLHLSINLPPSTGNGNKIAAAAEQPRNGVNSFLKSKNSDRSAHENVGLTARSLHVSINLPSGTGKGNNTAAVAEKSRKGANNVLNSKKAIGGSVEMKGLTARSLNMSAIPLSCETRKSATAAVKPTLGANHTAKMMKVVGEPVEKRATSGSLHTSISLPSGAGLTSKIPSLFERNGSEKFVSSLPSVSKRHHVSSQAFTKASHGFLNRALANPPSQGRRTERLLSKSLSGGVTANAKFSSISVECPKSSTTTKSNPRSFTTSSPFRFRSEERALKRKEFLQRMDETKWKDEEKVHLRRIPKGKTT